MEGYYSKPFMMEAIEEIRQFADKAHDGQTRKYSGQRYIVHPVAVMQHRTT